MERMAEDDTEVEADEPKGGVAEIRRGVVGPFRVGELGIVYRDGEWEGGRKRKERGSFGGHGGDS